MWREKRIFPHAYVSSNINLVKAERNNTILFIEEMDAQKFDMHLNNAIIYGRKLVDQRKLSQAILNAEIGDRVNNKRQLRERSETNSNQRKLKKLKSYTFSAIMEKSPLLTPDFLDNILKKILAMI